MKRHAHQADYYGGEMVERPDGDYVLYVDAANLQRQLAKVTKERDGYGAMLDQARALGEEVLTAAEHVQRQLAEVTRERDTLKAMVQLHDALNDRRREKAAFQGAERRAHRD